MCWYSSRPRAWSLGLGGRAPLLNGPPRHLFGQEGEQGLKAGKVIRLATQGILQGNAPRPAPVIPPAVQAKEEGKVDVGCFPHRPFPLTWYPIVPGYRFQTVTTRGNHRLQAVGECRNSRYIPVGQMEARSKDRQGTVWMCYPRTVPYPATEREPIVMQPAVPAPAGTCNRTE